MRIKRTFTDEEESYIVGLYVENLKSILQISKELGIYTGLVSEILKKYSIPIRGRDGIPYPKAINSCSVCDETRKTMFLDAVRYCAKHYNQMKTYGEIRPRNKYDLNEIIKYDDFAEIVLYDTAANEVARAIIDLEDIDKVSMYKWQLGGQNYVKSQSILLHKLLLEVSTSKEYMVDHINRNRLDNRKCNLRIVSPKENAINKGKQSNNTSGFPGVSYDKYHNAYEANIKIDRKKKFLGYFKDINDAIYARKQAEIKYFGEEINRDYDCNTVFKKKGKK